MNAEQLWQSLMAAVDAAMLAAGGGSALKGTFPDTEVKTFHTTLAHHLPDWWVVLGERMVTAVHQETNVAYVAELIAVAGGEQIRYLLGRVYRTDQPAPTR
jgi:hypothetical protein